MEKVRQSPEAEPMDLTHELLARDSVQPQEITRHFAERFPALQKAYKGIGAAGLSVETHTNRVLGQYEWFLRDGPVSQKYGKGLIRMFLALHDIGKPRSLTENLPKNEHQYTLELMDPVFETLQLDERNSLIVKALLMDDPVGLLLQNKMDVKDAVEAIVKMAAAAEVPPEDMRELMVTYFIADAGSYTEDAGGEKRLDFLFSFDRMNRQVTFSETARIKIDALQEAITKYGKS